MRRFTQLLGATWLIALTSLTSSPQAAARGIGDPTDPVLSSYFVIPRDQATMGAIADLFEVHHRVATGYELIVPAHRAKELLALAPNARLIEEDINAWADRLNGEWLAGYHTFETLQTHLKKIVQEHPEIASLEEYGKSKEGRPLFALKLSDSVGLDEGEPEVMLTSATHGDELISLEVLMGILDSIVAGYGTDARLTAMVDGHELFFLPVINPDGYTRKSRYSNGVDPNRDYPYPDLPVRNPNECIKGVIDFFHKHEIKGSIDYHASGGMFMYPWSYTHSSVDSADEKRFDEITTNMAKTNGYSHGQIPDLLYIAKGGSVDYYYWKNGSIAMAAEVGDTKIPPSSQIPRYIKENLEAAYMFIELFQ